MSLTLDVFEIARTGQTVEGELTLDDMPELAASVLELEGPIRFSVTGLGVIERLPAARLEIEGSVVMTCARCNDPVVYPIDGELVFRFTKTEAEANALPLDEEGDDEEVIVGSRALSVAAWVQEEVLLSLPAMPVHEDCEMDFEADDEEMIMSEKPNPFAALAALKKNN